MHTTNNWELWGIIIAIIEFDINYFIYVRTGSVNSIIIVIVLSLILALVFIISNVYSKIYDLSDKQDEIDKRLIRYGELEDIRLDLREIKRGVFKKR